MIGAEPFHGLEWTDFSATPLPFIRTPIMFITSRATTRWLDLDKTEGAWAQQTRLL